MISVIIPTYNRAVSIERSINSVLKQTYSDIELIVVDDGSTDKTKQVIDGIDDSRLRYYYQENSGACVARNKGIDLATGSYIAFQDSDDVWLPEKLEKQMHIFQETNADIVFCKLIRYENNTFKGYFPTNLRNGFISADDHLFGIGTQSIIAKKEVFKDVQFDPNMPRWQDLEWLIRVTDKYRLFFIDEGLVEYYVGADSISSNPQKLLTASKMILKKNPGFRKKKPLMSDNISWALINTGKDLLKRKDSDYQRFYALAGRFTMSRRMRIKSIFAALNLYPIVTVSCKVKECIGNAMKQLGGGKTPIEQFQIAYRERNKHNNTYAINMFSIDQVLVGRNTYGPVNLILFPKDAKLIIGNYVSIAPEVKFLGGAHYYKRISTWPFQSLVYKEATNTQKKHDITIEDDVWIGYDSLIMEGVTIGKGSVIGARSVVAKDVPPYSVFIGNKIYKKRFSDEIIEKLNQINYRDIEHTTGDLYQEYCQVEINDNNVDEILKAFINSIE